MTRPWWIYRRHCRNGRIHVVCRNNHGHHYWLLPHELATWTRCLHCAGWWRDPPGNTGDNGGNA